MSSHGRRDTVRAADDWRSPPWYRLAFVGTAMRLLAMVVTSPFSVARVVDAR